MHLEKAEKEEQYVRKLDVANFYHRLRLPEHLHAFFGLPPICIGENGEKWYPRLATVPIGWSHSVKILQAVHGELLFFELSLDERHEVKEGSLSTNLKCHFGRYIDDFFVFRTDKRRVM